MYWESYYQASSVEDAVNCLVQAKGGARIIAGGSDLVLQQRRGQSAAKTLVDITRIKDCANIEEADGAIIIGALATHAQAAQSPLIRSKLPALAQACAQVGSPQIRNVGTLAGNIVSAQPGADAALALHAFGAGVRVAGPNGVREADMEELYAGVGLCCLDSCAEMLTHIIVPMGGEPRRSAFERLAQRHTLSLPVINVAVALRLEADGKTIAQSRVSLGPVAPKPFRAAAAEEVLNGSLYSRGIAGQAADLASRDSSPRNSPLRGSADYRESMARVLTYRAIVRAMEEK